MKRQLLIIFIAAVLAGGADTLSDKLLTNITFEGVVYCRCNFTGYVARIDASPLSGVVVSVKCNIADYHSVATVMTDNAGYFRVTMRMTKKYVGHSCSVYVASSPLSRCAVPSQLTFTGKGSTLIYEREEQGVGPLYSAGLMIIGPANSTTCYA